MSNVKTFAQVALASSDTLANKHIELDAIYQDTQDTDTKREAQRALCHALQDAKLASLTQAEQEMLIAQVKSDETKEFTDILNSSREMKIRVHAMVKSASSGVAKRNKVLTTFCANLKKRKTFTIEQIQAMLNHDTNRQAGELLRNLHFMNMLESVERNENNKIVKATVNKDSAFTQALIKAYS